MNFLITGIVYCEADTHASTVLTAMTEFFEDRKIRVAGLRHLKQSSQHLVMFDAAITTDADHMGGLKKAILNVYPLYRSNKKDDHVSIALVTTDPARIEVIFENWASGHAARKPDPSENILNKRS